ncbi:MAG: kynureninase [Candidatus Dormibacteria bacterium]
MEETRRRAPRDRAACERLDNEDPLAPVRSRFHVPEGVVYLDGNSLGALPVGVGDRVARAIASEWGDGLVQSWTSAGWIELAARLGAMVAPLIGASPDEVLCCDSTSVNVFKLVGAAVAARPARPVILTEHANFPTDGYIADGLAALEGRHEVRRVLRSQVEEALREDVAVLLLTHVDYTSGYVHDMRGLTAAARAAGVLTIWDLSHSTGAMPVDLGGCGVDMAVGCGYKYLNGGPGAPAYIYVARRLHGLLETPLRGWMGHVRPFAFDTVYEPAAQMRRFLVGTPPILAMVALEAALEAWAGVDMQAVRNKSTQLTETFIALADARCAEFGVEVISPRPSRLRGSHVGLRHPHAYELIQALRAAGVVGDFRPPDIMRFGFAPLYNRFVDAWDAVDRLEEILRDESWREPRHALRLSVT